MTKIYVNNLVFKAVVGAFEFERIKPQNIRVDIECDYEFKGLYLDYAQVAKLTQERFTQKQYRVLEEGIDDLIEFLKSEFDNISQLKVKVTKPDIIKNCEVAVEKIS